MKFSSDLRLNLNTNTTRGIRQQAEKVTFHIQATGKTIIILRREEGGWGGGVKQSTASVENTPKRLKGGSLILIRQCKTCAVLVNDLSLVSGCFLFWKCVRFCFVFVFVAVCFFLLYALVFYVYCRVLPDVLSLMFFHVPPLGFLK